MSGKFLLEEMSWPEFQENIKDTGIVILPIASIEQHGPHLPLGTDSYVCWETAKIVGQKISKEFKVIVAPIIKIGLSTEHMDFPGTLSFRDPEAMITYVRDICKQLVQHGAKKILILNVHGGNRDSLKAATRMIRQDTGAFVVFASGSKGAVVSNENDRSTFDIHAGQGETSRMLYLHPELVRMDKAIEEWPEKFMKSTTMRTLDGNGSLPHG